MTKDALHRAGAASSLTLFDEDARDYERRYLHRMTRTTS
ncbi:hypothetical protein ROS217_07200 [Roseovarius sp. 217]|nr:hypothetical protein ROS217_07200 [Roseovarius sp. 217]